MDEMEFLRAKVERELNKTFNTESDENSLEISKLSKKLYKSCMDMGMDEFEKLVQSISF